MLTQAPHPRLCCREAQEDLKARMEMQAEIDKVIDELRKRVANIVREMSGEGIEPRRAGRTSAGVSADLPLLSCRAAKPAACAAVPGCSLLPCS